RSRGRCLRQSWGQSKFLRLPSVRRDVQGARIKRGEGGRRGDQGLRKTPKTTDALAKRACQPLPKHADEILPACLLSGSRFFLPCSPTRRMNSESYTVSERNEQPVGKMTTLQR